MPASAFLAGKVVTIDPGHNGGNASHPQIINQPVNIVNGTKACDDTGTGAPDGYTESAFNLDVALRLQALLTGQGAQVVMTRTTDTGVGPCITQRAAIGNQAHANAALSIHADGGPPGGAGFQILEPVDVGPNAAIVAPSDRLGLDLRNSFHTVTGEPYSTYAGTDALEPRSDLGGLNLSTVPKVFVECGNMQNPADEAKLENPQYRQLIAQALDDGLVSFLSGAQPG